jgi:TatD DNase family protein
LLAHLDVARATGLPLYLHNRESGHDLHELLSGYGDGLKGIVHSFDETMEIAEKFISLGLYIGINGCSLKTPENIETVRRLPLDRVILETDCPWCDVRPTHAGWVHVRTKTHPSIKEKKYTRDLGKGGREGEGGGGGYCVKNRTEPCHVAQVAEVIVGVRGIDVEEVVRVCGRNVHDLFGSMERRRRR